MTCTCTRCNVPLPANKAITVGGMIYCWPCSTGVVNGLFKRYDTPKARKFQAATGKASREVAKRQKAAFGTVGLPDQEDLFET